jgi:hypothetical protein
MIAKASQEETHGDEGIEVVTNEEFEDERGKGIFTFKKIHLTEFVHKTTKNWSKKIARNLT